MRTYKDFAFKSIKELVEEGIKLSRSISSNDFQQYGRYHQTGFSYADNSFQRWADYSQKIIELSTKELDTSIYLNYLRLLLSLQQNVNMPADRKLAACLDFLIEVLKIITRYQ